MDLRTAEERLWAAVGVTPVEHRLDLPRLGIDVRVTEVGEGRPAVFVHGATVAGADHLVVDVLDALELDSAALRRAIDDGYFKNEAYDWLVALFRQTDTMFNETASGEGTSSV